MAAVGAGWVTPREFWQMHPQEFWWLYDAKMPPQKRKGQNLNELAEQLKRWQEDENRDTDS